MSGRRSGLCLYETNRVAIIESVCAGACYRFFQVVWVLSILVLVIVFGAFRTLQPSTFVPALQKRPDLVYVPGLVDRVGAVDTIDASKCAGTTRAIAPFSSFSADYYGECTAQATADVVVACATEQMSTDVMYAPTGGMDSVVVATSVVSSSVDTAGGVACPSNTTVVLFSSNNPLFIELGFFAASDYILNFDPNNQNTPRDYWTSDWFASGVAGATGTSVQSGTAYSMAVKVVDQNGNVLTSCNAGAKAPCTFEAKESVVLTLFDILTAAGVGGGGGTADVPGDLDNTNSAYNEALLDLDSTAFSATATSGLEHTFRLSGLDVVAFVSYSNLDPACALRQDFSASCYVSNLQRQDAHAVIYFKSMTTATPVYSDVQTATGSTPEALLTYYGVRVSVASSGRLYDGFNFWVLMVAVVLSTMLFVVLVAVLECTLFFESRLANMFACCARGEDSAASASTEVRRRQNRQFRKLIQELKYKHPIQRRTQDDIVMETVNLVDLHCEPVGRVDQSGNTAETLEQLKLTVERKRNVLKSLLRRELQTLDADADAAARHRLRSRGWRGTGGASGARGRAAGSKGAEAKLAARLFARSQAVSMLLNRSTLASTADEGARDDNLLRIMISECFGALAQVANKAGSMFTVSALQGWDPIDYYPTDADAKAVDKLLERDLVKARTDVGGDGAGGRRGAKPTGLSGPASGPAAALASAPADSSGGSGSASGTAAGGGVGGDDDDADAGAAPFAGGGDGWRDHDLSSSDEEDTAAARGGGVNLKYLI